MKRLLFITNRNILTTSGELRLIKNRAEAMAKFYNIVTDFIVWQKKSRIDSPNREMINSFGSMSTYALSDFNVFRNLASSSRIKKEIVKKLQSNEYDAVILSGSGISDFAKFIKKHSTIKIIIDVHGSSEDILELTKNDSLFKRIKSRLVYTIETRSFKNNFPLADGCFVVTHALEEYVRSKYRISENFAFYIAPCGTEDVSIKEEEYYANRDKYRKKYGIGDSTKAIIYSGGVSSWQCIKETIDLFENIKQKSTFPIVFLMFSHRPDIIKSYIGNDNDIIVDSYKPEELKKVLCAGDIAVMLRKNNITNNVAFPNKFLEYVASCMNVISTPYVLDIAHQIEDNDIGFIYDFQDDISDLLAFIKKSSRKDFSKYERILRYNGFKERLKEFDSDIEK